MKRFLQKFVVGRWVIRRSSNEIACVSPESTVRELVLHWLPTLRIERINLRPSNSREAKLLKRTQALKHFEIEEFDGLINGLPTRISKIVPLVNPPGRRFVLD